MPAKEVTFANLNDNIDGKFLEEMCAKFGEILECRIYYNLKTKKHLGLGKVLFQTQRSAKECCLHFNQTSKMGNLMSVFLDTMGLERSKMVDSLCNNVTSSNSSQNIASNLIRYYIWKNTFGYEIYFLFKSFYQLIIIKNMKIHNWKFFVN